MPGEHQVGGGFAGARGDVDIAAQATGGLLADQLLPVFPLGDELVAGGKVDNDLGAVEGQEGAGGQRRPQVLAQLHAEADAVLAGEHQLPAQRQRLPAEANLLGPQAETAGKPALFIKLVVIGWKELWHRAQQTPMGQDHGAIVQRAVHAQGRAHHGGQPLRALTAQLPESGLHGVQQRFLKKQVAAGVARQAQLRENHQAGLFFGCPAHHFADGRRVFLHVAKPQHGHCRGYAHQSFHGIPSLCG